MPPGMTTMTKTTPHAATVLPPAPRTVLGDNAVVHLFNTFIQWLSY